MKINVFKGVFFTLLLFVMSSIVLEAKTSQAVQFSSVELYLIQTLSSQRYVNRPDSSNRVSGNSAAIKFGKKLFFDSRLSGDNSVSCSTCHNPAMAWANHEKITSPRSAHPSSRHVPSLWGVKYNRWYFWDGRTDSLWSQALKPIENIAEMAGSRTQVATLIINTPKLREDYEVLFGAIPTVLLEAKLPVIAHPVDGDKQSVANQEWLKLSSKQRLGINRLFSNIGKSIASFEETLISTNSPFDKFAINLSSNKKEKSNQGEFLSTASKRGLKLFIGKAACINCHFGPNFSDGEFHHSFLEPITLKNDLGRFEGISQLHKDPFNGHSRFSDRANSTSGKKQHNKLDYVYQNVEFRGQFKTPSLRNVAKSYPYMHTGEFKTLNDVMDYYNTISRRNNPDEHQEVLLKSLKLSKQEMSDLVEFLKSLSDTTG